MDILGTVIGGAIAAVVVIAILVRLLSWLYLKSSGDVALVRTGFGGAKVIRNGGALVIPVLHQTTPVSLSTHRLEVRRADRGALQTRDNMRVNVTGAFYVHVEPEREALLRAVATLGARTMNPEALRDLIEGKFVDALRAAAAETDMRTLHEQRGDYVSRVAERVRDDLKVNGLALESVSLTEFDQSAREFFDPGNAFDAEGLTQLARTIEDRRRQRNEIERDTELAIQRKALDVEAKQLEITKTQLGLEREAEFARLAQKQDVAQRRAQQQAEVAREDATQQQTARSAQIAAERAVQEDEIGAKREVEAQRVEADRSLALSRIAAEQSVKEQEFKRAEAVDLAAVKRAVVVQTAEAERDIALAKKSLERSLGVAASEAGQLRSREEVERAQLDVHRAVELSRVEADQAIAKGRIAAEREVKESETAKALAVERAQVERETALQLAEQGRVIAVAQKAVERYAALIASDQKRAEAEAQEQAVVTAREAAIAGGKKTVADIEAARSLIVARGAAEAEHARLAGEQRRHAIEAEARAAQLEADNRSSPEQVRLRLQLAMLDRLPDIIRESAKPVEAIDKIQIVQVEGLGGGTAHGAAGDGGGSGPHNFAEQVMTSALRYRAQAPVVDAVLGELGLDGRSLHGLAQHLPSALKPVAAAQALDGAAALSSAGINGPRPASP